MGAEAVVNPSEPLTPTLEVVLATYNGADFLDQQLQSLLQQWKQPDQLIVQDDGSTDGTAAILLEWGERHPNWIRQLPPSAQRLGPKAMFSTLLSVTTAPYVALCDQDDVWKPQRLLHGLNLIQSVEQQSPKGSNQPLLVHSDAELIDTNGHPLSKTLWQWHHVDEDPAPLWRLWIRNQITGCTVLVNRALLDLALPIPAEAILHDWWLALIACKTGGLNATPEMLVQHRRHHSNASGGSIHPWRKPIKLTRKFHAAIKQFQALQRRYLEH